MSESGEDIQAKGEAAGQGQVPPSPDQRLGKENLEATRNYHPIIGEVLGELEEADKVYFDARDFRTTFAQELEVLSVNIEHLVSGYGQDRIRHVRYGAPAETAGESDQDALKRHLTDCIRYFISKDKEIAGDNKDQFDKFPHGRFRSNLVQIARQGYLAYLNREVESGNVGAEVRDRLDETGFPSHWRCTIPVPAGSLAVDQARNLLRQPDFPSDNAIVLNFQGHGKNISPDSLDFKEVNGIFSGIKLSPCILHLDVYVYDLDNPDFVPLLNMVRSSNLKTVSIQPKGMRPRDKEKKEVAMVEETFKDAVNAKGEKVEVWTGLRKNLLTK